MAASSSEVSTEGEPYTIFTDRPIGRGAYSVVFDGRTARGRRVAVKTACKRIEIVAMRTEVNILKKLSGEPNIIQLVGTRNEFNPPGSVVRETFSFAMEFARGSLEAEMKRPANCKGLPADVLFDLVVDCAMALSALHRKNIAHRDIKHMNILLFAGSRTRGRRSDHLFKLCDMGCSKELHTAQEMNTLVGTPKLLHPYLAREMLDPRMARNQHNHQTQQPYTPEQCDLWSLGCTLYFCATGKFPIDHEKDDVYFNAVQAMNQNPDAIGMEVTTRRTAQNKLRIEFVPITELPSKHTRYPKWFVATLSCIIRHFFHDPSIDRFVEVATAMRKATRKQFVSIDQLTIVDHTDVSQVPYVGHSVPSLSECIGYPSGIDLLLVSNTTCSEFDSKRKSLDGLKEDVFLVVPQRGEVAVRKIYARNTIFEETEEMSERKLAAVRLEKCHEGYSMMEETDEYCRLFETASKILATQFNLLVDELNQFEPIQMASRFAVYLETMTALLMMFDEASPSSKTTSSQCMRLAEQAREELEKHTKDSMDIEQTAKQLAEESAAVSLDVIDLAGMREDLEMYAFETKEDVLASSQYSTDLIVQIFEHRNSALEQIFKVAGGMKYSKLKLAVDLAASLTELRARCHKVQKTKAECVDLLERPFQEMKALVSRDLQKHGYLNHSMQKSTHLLSAEFLENQKRGRKAARNTRQLVSQLNKELEEIKKLGFERIGDTLLRAETQTVGEPDTEHQAAGCETVPTCRTFDCCCCQCCEPRFQK